jgi:hypothetical protein
VHEEDEDGEQQDRHRPARLGRVLDRPRRVEAHHPPARLRRHLQPRAERQIEPWDHDGQRHHDDRREVRDERPEREPGVPRDQDVRRIADQRRGAADVRGHDLDHDQRHRVDVERVGQQERDRHDQQDRRHVVEEGRQHRGGHGKREHNRERPAARPLACADREPRVDARRLRQPDHDHHADEQSDRVEVDRLDRLLLIERARQHDECRAQQGDLGAVDPL